MKMRKRKHIARSKPSKIIIGFISDTIWGMCFSANDFSSRPVDFNLTHFLKSTAARDTQTFDWSNSKPSGYAS